MSTCARGAPGAPLRMAPGTLEGYKWLALACMTLDHAERHLWHTGWWPLEALGRLAMPVFCFTLAHSLAQPGALARGVHRRVMWRLALAGACAVPALAGLGVLHHGWWPLNVMLTLLAGTAAVGQLERAGHWGPVCAVAIVVAAGPVVEFLWFGLACFVSAWAVCRRPDGPRLGFFVGAVASLWFVNGTHWALLAVPLLRFGHHAQLRVGRVRYFFYGYYPLHLTLLYVLR